MAQIKQELKDILDRYGIDPRDKSQVWDCHGVLVLYHRAYEIIAAKEKIAFDPPTIIEGSSEKKTVALLVVGRMGDRAEWSIGEAAPGNNKNSYPYAMAEKRAKDRVIAKLAGLAAYVYSEAEADDFVAAKPTGDSSPADRGGNPASAQSASSAPASPPASPPPPPGNAYAWVGPNGAVEAAFPRAMTWMEHAEKTLRESVEPRTVWMHNLDTFERIRVNAQSLRGDTAKAVNQRVNGLVSFLDANGLKTELPPGIAA